MILSATISGTSIASFATAFGASVGIASPGFSFAFTLALGIFKKTIKNKRKWKEEAQEIFFSYMD